MSSRDRTLRRIRISGNLIVIVAVVIWSARGMDVDLERIGRGVGTIGRIIGAMFPPDWNYLGRSVAAMIESIQIAIIGTTVAALLTLPISFLAAKNLGTPDPVVWAFKQLLNGIRAFPELVLGIFFVASYGPGALAGVMAIGLNSVGMLGKLNAEIVENIDRGPIEALEATGGNQAEVFLYAILPQVVPEFVATALYRFELNLRNATVLGLVGAGGIGVILLQALQFRRWPIVGMALLTVVIAVTVIDYTSSYVRKRIN
ncbi:MAG: phosphonate ABC transporter, permease protein PhnE [Spirochaetaceae bacterium]|nr:MAG: phosphonate ABC transporter, permease protein PhnE [Spirochaetaceae bacterium]